MALTRLIICAPTEQDPIVGPQSARLAHAPSTRERQRMKRSARRTGRLAAGAMAALAGAALIGAVLPASAATAKGWPAYLNGPMHSSYNAAEMAITPAR